MWGRMASCGRLPIGLFCTAGFSLRRVLARYGAAFTSSAVAAAAKPTGG